MAVKPFVNLHLTPNGCGVLGCDKTSVDELIPKGLVDAITNPFGLNSPDYSSHGLSSQYTAPSVPSPSYGVPDSSYLAPSSGYGAPSYEAPSSGYGPPPKPSYNAPLTSYTPPKPSYSAPSTGYGPPPKPSYEVPKPSYKVPKPSYEAPKPSYTAPKPSYEVPKPSYHQPSHHSSGDVGDIGEVSYNIHHHYHHNPQAAHTREETEFNDSFYLEDNNQVKRNTEGFVPMQPNIGGESSSSNSGFRFPRERGSRKLDLDKVVAESGKFVFADEDNDEDEVEDSDTSDAEVTKTEESPEEVPAKSTFKFADNRKKRSPDGVGHHVHGHHDVQSDDQVFVRHVLPSQLTERVGHPEPFGPAGFRPPTCGGPGSGYVCCSVPGTSSSLDVGFGELQQLQQTGNTIRDIRQQPEQFSQALNSVATTSQHQFSQYGQCGKRNAHGVNGRINNPAQR